MGGVSPDPKNGVYMGGWGNFGTVHPQRGIITYSLASNRQRPLAGAMYNAIFNTWRRCKAQFLYVVPPFVIAYATMNWAVERNEYLNSKPGRLAEGASEE
ncbi:ubiquinol--cytochrome-c reductase subunit 8 [Emydomyces testavorans]|uniref:Cytochrome b-c1 complex subunit 8 n=1 Tax=Emydomyces testavorans TaxID=2070801 RepID=A0AAF0IGA3_9EURO|nr:ubiquinol--cytochrome-c reductase subunit 8 [Emydomyces testavorans]